MLKTQQGEDEWADVYSKKSAHVYKAGYTNSDPYKLPPHLEEAVKAGKFKRILDAGQDHVLWRANSGAKDISRLFAISWLLALTIVLCSGSVRSEVRFLPARLADSATRVCFL